MKTLAIIQARMDSNRLPGKVMKKLNSKTLINIVLDRVNLSKKIDQIYLATSINNSNDTLSSHVKKIGYNCYRGSEYDVLDRFYTLAKKIKPKYIVRITGDCPLVDYRIIDKMILKISNSDYDYVSNIAPPTYPDGIDVEVFTFNALKQAWHKAISLKDREHVTPYIINSSKFKKFNILSAKNYSSMRWTVDLKEDLKVIKCVFKHFSPQINFSWREVLNLSSKNPNIFKFNKNFKRNESLSQNLNLEMWKRAKKIIPGGNMLLSKRPELYLPNGWPAYFVKAKGCKVTDLNGKVFYDLSNMGVGTNILGYANDEIDDEIKKTIGLGNMSSLNSYEEVYLAENLITLHPWSSKVKFARTGAEACAIAIRIARAFSGKDNVAFSGYHGWHDWYLAANVSNSNNLKSHLLPGLEPKGVPKNLKNTIFPFEFNDFDKLKKLVKYKNIGVINMEVTRNNPPKDDFLMKVRKLADENNIVLIFDECTTGFRETNGGLHLKYRVFPDICTFGKALGNGYAITAVIGKKDIMEEAQISFISSTFWTERIGSAAANKTLEIMKRINSWDIITKKGKNIQKLWKKMADKNSLDIEINGIPALTSFRFKSLKSLEYKTYITQEMLKKGFLSSNTIYLSTEHTQDIIEEYIYNLGILFPIISDCENGKDINKLLEYPVCQTGFKRLN